jgi:hypothetical protein
MVTLLISVIINLLLTTSSLNKSIREVAVQCLQIVQEKIEENAFNAVLKKVLRCLPEIVADHEFIASVLLINNWPVDIFNHQNFYNFLVSCFRGI